MSQCLACGRDIMPGTGLRCNACRVSDSGRNARRIARKAKAAVMGKVEKVSQEEWVDTGATLFGRPVMASQLWDSSALRGSSSMALNGVDYGRPVEYRAGLKGEVYYRKGNSDEWVRLGSEQEAEEAKTPAQKVDGAIERGTFSTAGWCENCNFQRLIDKDGAGYCTCCFLRKMLEKANDEIEFESIEVWCQEKYQTAALEYALDEQSAMTEDQKQAKYGPVVATLASSSSPGRRYQVRCAGESYSCNCTGWRFKRTCRHTDYCKRNSVGVVRDLLLEALASSFDEIGFGPTWREIARNGNDRTIVSALRRRIAVLEPGLFEPSATERTTEGDRLIILED